ncbi:MAG: type II and III secretion system protein [Planctomycetes bacterium]|nr:type II and III secretion system protein [Planctomycetota bacterium]
MIQAARTVGPLFVLALLGLGCQSELHQPRKDLTVTTDATPPAALEILEDTRPEQPSMITADGQMMKMYYTRQGKSAVLKQLIEKTFPEGIKITTHPDFHKYKSGGLDLLLVEGPVARVEDVDSFIALVEADVLQVEINVRVVEVTRTNADQRGISVALEEDPAHRSTLFNRLTSAFSAAGFLQSLSPGGLQGGPLAFQGTRLLADTYQQHLQLDVAIEVLKQFQEVEVLSAPSVRVLNGHEAYIETGERTPIQTANFNQAGITTVTTTFQTTGVQLKVVPTVVAEDTIRLEVEPQVTSVTGYSDPATSGGVAVPYISTRKANTVVNVKHGEIFLLGGLYYTTELVQESKLPLLGDIPILGWLFSSSNKAYSTSEILFFLQPQIITPQSGARGRLVLPPEELK